MSQLFHHLAMGGYALYVWPAYALVFIVLIAHVLGLRVQRVLLRKKLQQWFKSQAK